MNIAIQTVPHSRQRYDTAGDYFEIGRFWILQISKLPNWRMEAALIIHEMVEMFLTKHRGIPWEKIDQFDMEHPELDDPGADPEAPYHREHMTATDFEKQICLLLGLDWEEYQQALDSLSVSVDSHGVSADSNTGG